MHNYNKNNPEWVERGTGKPDEIIIHSEKVSSPLLIKALAGFYSIATDNPVFH